METGRGNTRRQGSMALIESRAGQPAADIHSGADGGKTPYFLPLSILERGLGGEVK